MSENTERLDAIEARSAGLTDLCAEHLRQSIRHVQRNCDIDCNVHEDETTWDDCRQPGRYDGDRMAAVLADVPFLLDLARKQQAALNGVLAELERRAVQYRATADGLWELVRQRHPDRNVEDAQRYEAYANGARAAVDSIRNALDETS